MTQVQTLLAILGSALMISTSVLGVGVWAKRRYFDPLSQMVEEWRGEPGNEARGIPARPGALERVTALERSMHEVRSEVRPNGGSSLRDAVNRIEQQVGGST